MKDIENESRESCCCIRTFCQQCFVCKQAIASQCFDSPFRSLSNNNTINLKDGAEQRKLQNIQNVEKKFLAKVSNNDEKVRSKIVYASRLCTVY